MDNVEAMDKNRKIELLLVFYILRLYILRLYSVRAINCWTAWLHIIPLLRLLDIQLKTKPSISLCLSLVTSSSSRNHIHIVNESEIVKECTMGYKAQDQELKVCQEELMINRLPLHFDSHDLNTYRLKNIKISRIFL